MRMCSSHLRIRVTNPGTIRRRGFPLWSGYSSTPKTNHGNGFNISVPSSIRSQGKALGRPPTQHKRIPSRIIPGNGAERPPSACSAGHIGFGKPMTPAPEAPATGHVRIARDMVKPETRTAGAANTSATFCAKGRRQIQVRSRDFQYFRPPPPRWAIHHPVLTGKRV